MANDKYNPIRSVDGVAVKCPSSYKWSLQDVSASDAGRSESVIMDKNRIAQKRKVVLEWQNISIEECSDILNKFNPEYLSITYLDLMSGRYETRTFYVGDRTAPLYNVSKGIVSSLGFDIIER